MIVMVKPETVDPDPTGFVTLYRKGSTVLNLRRSSSVSELIPGVKTDL